MLGAARTDSDSHVHFATPEGKTACGQLIAGHDVGIAIINCPECLDWLEKRVSAGIPNWPPPEGDKGPGLDG